MLAVTSHVSTDIAAIPLLWVIPLAIYLATFVAAFARESREIPRRATHLAVGSRSLPPSAACSPQASCSSRWDSRWSCSPWSDTPRTRAWPLTVRLPERLTTYFLVVAAGGALGGLLNGLLAPVVFDRVLEYPLVMVAVPAPHGRTVPP